MKGLSLLLRIAGTALILIVVIPLLLTQFIRITGGEVYSITSGSMEPEIPVGSVIYVADIEPENIVEGDVIAFRSGGSVICHRVRENRPVTGEFITKGDANMAEDFSSVPYGSLLGKVEKHYPYVGRALSIYATDIGKAYVFVFAACGFMFNVLAGRIRYRRKQKRKAKEDKQFLQDMLKEQKEKEHRN